MSFRFKQFSVDDSCCAMKVGTDGVLLGAWADCGVQPVDSFLASPAAECRILDVGTGSGLVALMLAQRSPLAHITGIDIDNLAIRQAADNFRSSPWAERLTAECVSLQDYAKRGGLFEFIVSNPPYFNNSLKTPDAARTAARHTDTLSLDELFSCSAALLVDGGVLSVILPAWDESKILQTAAQNHLTLQRVLRVQGRAEKPVKRLLLSFVRNIEEQTSVIEESLVLEEGVNMRTADYKTLTHDFYL